MKVALRTFCLYATVSVASLLPGERDLVAYTYEHYEVEFGKVRALGTERNSRKRIFDQNMEMIREHNADSKKTWFATVNEYTDMTNDEFRAARIARVPSPFVEFSGSVTEHTEEVLLEHLPHSIDWRIKKTKKKHNIVTPPKQQGGCGSCWAFSAAETLESHYAIATGDAAPELSPQQITSCTPDPKQCGGAGGCQGATQQLAFKYTEHAGITTEKNYPYTGKTGTCKKSKIKPVARNSGFVILPRNNYAALMGAVATKGPIAISVAAGADGWNSYGGGVFSGNHHHPRRRRHRPSFGCGFVMDHGVQLVGYGEDSGKLYWLVRNSWGHHWGEKGYIRILRLGEGKEPCGVDKNPSDGDACKGNTTKPTYCGVCAILSSSTYPTGVKKVRETLVV